MTKPGTHKKTGTKRALILAGCGARGAYQAGVWQHLTQQNWQPDLICGSSAGAINGVAIGCGMSASELCKLWEVMRNSSIHQRRLLNFMGGLFRGEYMAPLTLEPLRQFLSEKLNLNNLNTNPTEIIITTVNLIESKPCYFKSDEIKIEHIVASCSVPYLFPWQKLGDAPHWDGGIMSNVPLLPALLSRADEIIIVLSSPVGSQRKCKPTGHRQLIEHFFEQLLLGSYANLLETYNYNESYKPTIRIVAPEEPLGLLSLLVFSKKRATRLIELGMENAERQLAEPSTPEARVDPADC